MPHPHLGLNGFGLLTGFGDTAAHRVGAATGSDTRLTKPLDCPTADWQAS